MSCYVVVQSFFNPVYGAEGKLGEFLEISDKDAATLGARYLKKVPKAKVDALKDRRIAPRVVSLPQKKKEAENIPEETKRGRPVRDKMQRTTKNK